MRISREYVPSRLTEVQENAQRANASKSSGLIDHARILVDREDYMGAIQTYIQVYHITFFLKIPFQHLSNFDI